MNGFGVEPPVGVPMVRVVDEQGNEVLRVMHDFKECPTRCIGRGSICPEDGR